MEMKTIPQLFWRSSLYHSLYIGANYKSFLQKAKPRQLIGILLLAFLSIHPVAVQAQTLDSKVTYELKNKSLDEGLQLLGQLSKYKIAYSVQEMAKYKNITIEKAQRSVETTLDLLLSNTNLTYKVKDKTLLIVAKGIALDITNNSPENSTARQISGIVTNGENEPLAGVTIRINNSSKGTVTDAEGKYNIEADQGDLIAYSSIGYQAFQLKISDKTTYNIQLNEDLKRLDEIQVIGYGTTTKRLNTSSVSSITSEQIGTQTITNPILALQARASGVQITQDNGLPGSRVRVNIRGTSSIGYAGAVPLYVIDGVPFTLSSGSTGASADNLNAYGIYGPEGGISPLSMINPDDIERIDVLKDADATAIYGSRGSNGVVLITTKKGSQGKTEVNVNVNHGTGKVGHFIPMMNTAEYLEMRTEAFANAGVTPATSNAKDLTTWDQTAYTDWQKWLLGGTAQTTNATASISGGNAQNRFLLTTTYRKEGTVYGGSYGANSFSGRINAGHTSKNGRFIINASATYSYRNNKLPGADMAILYNLPPNYSLYNNDGSWNWDITNPLSYLAQKYNAKTNNFMGDADFSYEVAKGLRLKGTFGYSKTGVEQTKTNPASSQNPSGTTTSTLNYADNQNENYIVEPQAEYKAAFYGGNLLVLVGTTYQQTKSTGLSLTGSGYSNENLINSLVAASSVTVNSNNNSTYRYKALFGKLNYDWKQKYILNGTIRRDGSSRFGENHRFGVFGALGLGWIFTQEKFIKDQHILSFGKLRASYGITGNDQIPNYQYQELYSIAGTYFNYEGSTVLYPSSISNPDLHWEVLKKLNIALELGFLNDRILLKADYYRNRSSDILGYYTLPYQTGATSYIRNLPAAVQNRGWELELNTVNVDLKGFKWTSFLNLTINRNKLLSFRNLEASSYTNTYAVGHSIEVPLVYHFTGIDKSTGLPTLEDVNGDGSLTSAGDYLPAKAGHPFYGGLSNSLTYKSLQLDFTFQFNHRMGWVNNSVRSTSEPFGYAYTNQSEAIVSRWRQVNDDATYAKATVSPSYTTLYSRYLYSSDANWGDASYIKLKTVSLNYHLPKNWLSKIGLTAGTVYLQGQNLFTWAKQKYNFDTETAYTATASITSSSGNVDDSNTFTPPLRTIVAGLNITF
jgi:TonB-linked SusC/RagA family outer membrane protein